MSQWAFLRAELGAQVVPCNFLGFSSAKVTLAILPLLFQIQWTKLKTHPICLVMFILLFVPSLPNSVKGNSEVHAPMAA